eukprot:121571_1
MSLAEACTPSTHINALRQSLSHTLTIDLQNFNHGGRIPLYQTYESSVKFPNPPQHNSDCKSSSEDELFLPHDDLTDSDDLGIEPAPLSPKHVSNITPYIASNGAKSPKTSIVFHEDLEHIQSDSVTRSKGVSFTVPRARSRSGAKTPKKKRHLTRNSFHHFRIHSITIHGDSALEMSHNEHSKDNPLDEALMNALINANDALDPNSVIDDADTNKKPHHEASGTVVLHDPTSSPVDGTQKRRVTFQEPDTDPKRDFIEREIITTEETYYRGLDVLLTELIMPMFDEELIEDKYYSECVSNLPELIAFHDSFLMQLIEAYEHEDDEKDGDSFTSMAQVFTRQNKKEFVDMYMRYIRDYDAILNLFGNTFHNNVEVQTFLKQKRKEKKPLTNYLILPVQRVPRYILLLTDLKKHTKPTDRDYKNIESALEFVDEITKEINERQRKIENFTQCLQIQEALSNLTQPIVKTNRTYQKQFVFVKKSNKHQRQFFCFNDVVIMTNHHWVVKEIMDIRIVDIKRKEGDAVKKKISFRMASNKNRDDMKEDAQPTELKKKRTLRDRFGGHKNKDDHDEQMEETFSEFVLLYANVKPCTYFSKTEEDVVEFEKLIKNNRLMMIDHDLAQAGGTAEIRETLKVVGVSQADDYQQEIKSKRTKRARGNASADFHPLDL